MKKGLELGQELCVYGGSQSELLSPRFSLIAAKTGLIVGLSSSLGYIEIA